MRNLVKLCEEALNAIDVKGEIYTKEKLLNSLKHILRENMSSNDMINSIIQVCLELTTPTEPKWLDCASRLYIIKLYDEVRENRNILEERSLYENFYDFILELTEKGLYGKYILDNYSKADVDELEKYIKEDRDFLFTYSGIKLLSSRYLIQDFNRKIIELPQQMFMGIAMHLAIPEKNEKRVYFAKRFYDVLSSLKATMATPTMSNARKPFYQLSSCFIDTVHDSLKGIYKSLDNFANVSKFGGEWVCILGR